MSCGGCGGFKSDEIKITIDGEDFPFFQCVFETINTKDGKKVTTFRIITKEDSDQGRLYS